jgi:TetR/AcrR family transcriptional regulator, transcriptional repressor for nem operon
MADQSVETAPQARLLTARGAAIRDRLVRAAADRMYVKGANATALDDVRAATGTSKSQLYHHFPDKEALVREVIMLGVIDALVWPSLRVEIEVTAVRPAS